MGAFICLSITCAIGSGALASSLVQESCGRVLCASTVCSTCGVVTSSSVNNGRCNGEVVMSEMEEVPRVCVSCIFLFCGASLIVSCTGNIVFAGTCAFWMTTMHCTFPVSRKFCTSIECFAVKLLYSALTELSVGLRDALAKSLPSAPTVCAICSFVFLGIAVCIFSEARWQASSYMKTLGNLLITV